MKRSMASIAIAVCGLAPCGAGTIDLKDSVTDARTAALVIEARRALTTDRPFDLRRPFEQPTIHPRAGALYLEACRAGEAASCWLAMEIGERSARAIVEANCAMGDRLSCRALPDPHHAFNAIQEEDLRAGCADDQAASCAGLIRIDAMNGIEREQAYQHARQLAREGCARGLLSECWVWTGGEDDRVRFGWQCDLTQTGCVLLSRSYLLAGDRDKARAALERACQYGNDLHGWREPNCAELARAYIDGKLTEPVRGRGRALLDWACSRIRKAYSDLGESPEEFRQERNCSGWDGPD